MVLYCWFLTEQWPRFFVSLPAICVFSLGPVLFTIFSALMLDGYYDTCTRQIYVDRAWCFPDCEFFPDRAVDHPQKFFGVSNPWWQMDPCSSANSSSCKLRFGIRDVPSWAISSVYRTKCRDEADESHPPHPPGYNANTSNRAVKGNANRDTTSTTNRDTTSNNAATSNSPATSNAGAKTSDVSSGSGSGGDQGTPLTTTIATTTTAGGTASGSPTINNTTNGVTATVTAKATNKKPVSMNITTTTTLSTTTTTLSTTPTTTATTPAPPATVATTPAAVTRENVTAQTPPCSAQQPEKCAREYTQRVNIELRRLSRFSQSCREVLKMQPRYEGQPEFEAFASDICPKPVWVLLTQRDRGALVDYAGFFVNQVPGIAFILIGLCWVATFAWTLVDLIKGISMTGCFCPGIDGTLIHGPGHNVVQSVLIYLGALLIAIWPHRSFMVRMAPLTVSAFWLGVKAMYYPINHKISGNAWQGGSNLLGQAWSMNYGVMSASAIVQLFTLSARLDEFCCTSNWGVVFLPMWVWSGTATVGWSLFYNFNVRYYFFDGYDQEVDSGYLCFQFVFFLGIAVFLSCLLVVVAVNLETYNTITLRYFGAWLWVISPILFFYGMLLALLLFDQSGDAYHRIKIGVQNLAQRTRKHRVERDERHRRRIGVELTEKSKADQPHASVTDHEANPEGAPATGEGGLATEEGAMAIDEDAIATQRFCEHIGSIRTSESVMFCRAVLGDLATLLEENPIIRTDTNRELLSQACEGLVDNADAWDPSVAQLYKEIIVQFRSSGPELISAEIS